MKKLIVILLVFLTLLCVSCHKHTFSDAWSFDETTHYHESTCGHDVTTDKEPHTFDKGACSVCGYSKIAGKWIIDATAFKERLMTIINAMLDEMKEDYTDDEESFKAIYDMMMSRIDSEIIGQIEELNLSIEIYDNSNCLVSAYGESRMGTYRISDYNSLLVTVEGDEQRIGLFNDDFTSLDLTMADFEVAVPMIKQK